MTETTMDAAHPDEGSGHGEMDDLLERVREAVARTREVIRSTQEMLAAPHEPAPGDDHAAN